MTNTQEIPEKKAELQHFPQTLKYKASNILQSYRSNREKSGQILTDNFQVKLPYRDGQEVFLLRERQAATSFIDF